MTPELEIAIGIWLFVLGACVGSFLNVVIYRVPAGLSIVHPGSHCPKCKKAIRWHDNLPIVGWLILRGRCRDCKLPISWRYPAVETFVACMFVLLAVSELFTLAGNLPVSNKAGCGYEFANTAYVYGYHLMLLCTVFSAAMIRLDGGKIPIKLLLPALVVGVAMPFLFVAVHPIKGVFCPIRKVLSEKTPVDRTALLVPEILFGYVAGLVFASVGNVFAMWRRGERFDSNKEAQVFGLMGIYLGWWAITVIVSATLALRIVLDCVARLLKRPPPSWYVSIGLVFCCVWMAGWNTWSGLFADSGLSDPPLMPAAITLVVCICILSFVHNQRWTKWHD
jgi:leader peptidase (prepilin peptidase)/N-methyltransferase